MIISNFFLFRIESDTLADDCRFGACVAPDRKRHLESNCKYALTCFSCAISERMPVKYLAKSKERFDVRVVLASKLIGRHDSLMLRGDISSHIYSIFS